MQMSMLAPRCDTVWFLTQAGKGGELTHDETTIIQGALDLTEKVSLPSSQFILTSFFGVLADLCGYLTL